MIYFDRNPDVIKWSSEEVIVPYKSKIDGRYHRYYPDFIIKIKNKQNVIETVMIEVKPYAQTQEPKKRSRMTPQYINEVKTYGINISKWEAAEDYCKDRNWRFLILTERELGLD